MAAQPGMDVREVLVGVRELAIKAAAHWDADEGMKVGKILMALAGQLDRYDPRADAMSAAISKTEEGACPVVSVLESGAKPGRWIVKRRAAPCADNGDIGIVNENGTLVAVAYACSNAEGNANVIAAAPDLLAELECIANADPARWDAEVRDQFREWAQNRARAALSAVEGQP